MNGRLVGGAAGLIVWRDRITRFIILDDVQHDSTAAELPVDQTSRQLYNFAATDLPPSMKPPAPLAL